MKRNVSKCVAGEQFKARAQKKVLWQSVVDDLCLWTIHILNNPGYVTGQGTLIYPSPIPHNKRVCLKKIFECGYVLKYVWSLK